MSEQEEVNPVTRARQLACTHSFIKGMADRLPICVWCGLGKVEYENMQATQAMAPIWGGMP